MILRDETFYRFLLYPTELLGDVSFGLGDAVLIHADPQCQDYSFFSGSENFLTVQLFLSSQNFLNLAPKFEIWEISSHFRKITYFEGSKTFFLSPKSEISKISSKKSSKFPQFGTFSSKFPQFSVAEVAPKKNYRLGVLFALLQLVLGAGERLR